MDSLNSEDDDNHHLSPKVMELSKNQRQYLKKDERYTRLTDIVKRDASKDFEQHFEEYEEVVDTSLRMYMNDAFKGVIQPRASQVNMQSAPVETGGQQQ